MNSITSNPIINLFSFACPLASSPLPRITWLTQHLCMCLSCDVLGHYFKWYLFLIGVEVHRKCIKVISMSWLFYLFILSLLSMYSCFEDLSIILGRMQMKLDIGCSFGDRRELVECLWSILGDWCMFFDEYIKVFHLNLIILYLLYDRNSILKSKNAPLPIASVQKC